MTSTKTVPVFLVAFALLSLSCSSDPKAEYDETQKVLDASEHTIQQTFDYEIRIKTCDDAIASLNAFLVKHPKGEWPTVARNALDAWGSKKSAFQQELNAMLAQLSERLQQKAVEESKKVHSFSNIENMVLTSHTKSKEGYAITFQDAYSVRMRPPLFPSSIFKLVVRVTGRVQMDSKTVFVDESATVEE